MRGITVIAAMLLAGLAVSGCREGHPGHDSDHHHHRGHDNQHYR